MDEDSNPYGEALKKFARLDTRKRRLKERLERVTAECERAEQALKLQFEQVGQTRARAYNRTFYLKREVWASIDPLHTTEAYKALRALELDWMIKETVNSQTLSAWVREQPEDENMEHIVPAKLRPYLRVNDDYRVRTVKS